MRDPKCKLFDVYLNGVQQFNCTIADEEQGYVRQLFDRGTGKSYQKDTEGRVQIVRRGQKPPE